MSDFFARHLGAIDSDRDELLASLGFETLDQLTEAVVPEAIRLTEDLALPAALSEFEVQQRLTALAARNNPGVPMIGLGYHATVTPPILRRMVLENPAWYTAYTPYQPEISQGRLEALANFQTMIADLTGLPVAGASLLDEGTAVAEAVALARRASRRQGAVLVDPKLLPQSLAVLRTRCAAVGVEVRVAEAGVAAALEDEDYFAVVLQLPAADGTLPGQAELVELVDRAHQAGALVITAVDLLALTLIGSAGAWGADIAVGSAQRFGVPLFYGGPHAGFIAVRSGLERQLPGRIVGLSKDADGVPAFRLALQTREQHIRREKATSNICTAQVLLAVAAGCYAVHHGPEGLTAIASAAHRSATRLAAALVAAGYELASETFFDTLTVHTPGRADAIVAAARAAGVHLRRIDADAVGVSIGEGIGEDDLAAVSAAFGASAPTQDTWGGLGDHRRQGEFLTHPVFRNYRSETELMRYLRTLADRDFALDKGMIPLGSCTLKLNPAAAMEPISYPGFAGLHPFVAAADATGYAELVEQLCDWLAEITGYDQVSLQPNAGSQGEFAGLMAIRSYHLAQGQPERVVCLIPASAHGTNAASAVLAGMRVVVVATAADGSVDLDDLRAKIAEHAERLAAVMVTYPSTHGVFEDTITEICQLVHAAGGQVYVDGANLNAMLGLARPGRFGADVSHLNLHKTFAIPHGGGGPGVGPVAVRAHLAPFLPKHPLVEAAGPQTSYGPVSAGPFGSAGVLPISWAFIALMGPDGLKLASQTAILAANYVAHRLAPYFPVLYTGASGLVAHECIVDLRELSHQTGVSVDDVAKRLIDFGFHAPTMSFPVAGTLMIEPTESESKAELDRFCDAMIAIRGEMDQVAAGQWPADDNPLHNAPHPAARVLAGEWNHPYPRDLGAFPAGFATGPVGSGGRDKYWPAVGRIDGAYGDRNLICTCAPVSAYEDQSGEL
ncbi:glycine dehydrogenase (decarboxylating) alpha subunit /glycine dehydrogenase (decarboxylating) beta subunit [Propionicimonas paludicola]|uniref:Glycine dehydrogenase (decarboxylating) n=1 Tax=Propionicimonas paludicola TaxID=185243 RepID=A0A2A9CR16_9ACTN|nr:aminomethyl-transferring glycine dehydrogenase [Propionicimonas paludicola]PFG16631.1 glycine dehydrogenase (decarboxylating) alpha subunit /glycine dehydrogenase (decarboxylating) beta subunit [Propionicimonas paludicola]